MISKVVGAALNILINKARDKAADSLNDGDVTSERFREIIIRELKDIKHKLDALCKKDLKASIDFYETGVHLLYDYFAKQFIDGREKDSHDQQLFGGKDEGSYDQQFDGRDKDSNDQLSEGDLSSQNQLAADGDVSEQASGSTFLNYFQETYSLVADYFTKHNYKSSNKPQTQIADPPNEKEQKPLSDDRSASQKQHPIENTECLREAKRMFQLAQEYATLAFNNECLKGFDRITAQKLRITATILMHLDSPHAAVAFCKRYLEQLNSLRFVSEAFEIQEGEGFKAATRRLFDEGERKRVIETVSNINKFAFNFGRIAFPEGTELLKGWPNVVKTGKHVFPIPVQLKVLDGLVFSRDVAVNDQGTVACLSDGRVTVYSSDGRFISEFSYLSGSSIPVAISMDNKGNIYISELLIHSQQIMVGEHFVLNVYTKDGKRINKQGCSGNARSILLDSKNEIFVLNIEKEDQKKSVIKGRGKMYEVTLAALKEALTNKNSTTRQFLKERSLVLDVARKEGHEFVILGPQWRGISVYKNSYGETEIERITWNPKTGDVIHMGDDCLEIYAKERKSPFQFHVPAGGKAVLSPTGQIIAFESKKLYFF